MQAEQDIEDRKLELVEARLELAHKQEYETIRKQIMQVRGGGWRGGLLWVWLACSCRKNHGLGVGG